MEPITNNLPHRRRSKDQIKLLLEEFEQQKISVREFCALHEVSITTFQKWQSRYKQTAENKSKPTGFAKIKIASPDINCQSLLFAEVSGIKIYQPVAASYLKELC